MKKSTYILLILSIITLMSFCYLLGRKTAELTIEQRTQEDAELFKNHSQIK